MGAGCCRARGLPPGGAPPRPAWGPAWGSMGPDPGIASLRPGDKFHFNREPFIRQHLVVPEKPFASDGEYNRAFSSDGGCGLAVRPALPPLPTAPVPPPRTKRRARHPHAHHHGHHHVHSLGQPPMPPARTRRAKEAPDTDATCTRSEPEDDGELNPNDSILSPAHTMELLKRMAKVEARLGRATAAVRARSVDSLGPDALELGLGSLPAARFDGPRSLDLDLNKEHGVVGLASSLALQSWHERRPWSPPLSMSNSAVLLSPRQWRPLGSSAGDTVTAAPAALATSAPAEVGASSSSTSLAPASRQTASTMALSEFIKDTYDGERKEAAEYRPMSTVEVDEGSKATAISETGSITLPASVPPTRSAQPEARIQDSPFAGPPVVSSSEPQEPTPSPDSGRLASSHIHYLDVPLASTEVRAGSSNSLASSASSTTESLGELEDDILHMLSLAEPEAGKMQDQKDEVELPSSKPAVQQKQSIQNDSVPVLS